MAKNPPILAVALLLLSTGAAAQTMRRTAHPQDTLQNTNGNLAPFGVHSTGFAGEARVHLLVPRDELPGPGAVLWGIELHCTLAGTVDYASLAIRVGATPATSLAMDFASNLPPLTLDVLPAGPRSIAWSTADWVTLPFPQPYLHDGTSALLIEIQKLVQPAGSYPFVRMTTAGSPARPDRPAMVFAFNYPGSGVSNAALATASTAPVSFRLRWNNAPTLRLRSDPGASGNQFALGEDVAVLLQGDPGALWVLAAGSGMQPMALSIPGVAGPLRLLTPVVFASGALDGTGDGAHTVRMPTSPALVGFYLTYQAAMVSAVGQITLTNASDQFLNP